MISNRLSGLFVCLALIVFSACGAKQDKESKGDDEQVAPAPASEPTGGLFGGASAMAMGSMLSQAQKPGIYDAPKESADFSDSAPHMVVLNLAGSVVELEAMSLFGSTGTPLRRIQDRLHEIADNDETKALLLRVDGLGMGMAAAQELRASLLAFKAEGARGLYCHTENTANVAYYLLSACDSVGVAPTGGIMISGVAAMPVHLKGLLDRLGVKADFLHVGDYKGAAEPLTLDKPSKAMNETIAGILDQSYESLVAGIAEGRSLSVEQVRALIDTAMFSSAEAVTAKLADQEATFEAFRDDVAGSLEWQIVALKEQGEPGLGKIMELIGLQPRKRSSSDHIAVVYAVGNIIDGKGEGIIGARNQIASRTLSAALRRLAAADSVKAVVLRVDSGGGSALASELIWHAVEELKAKKPVVVSMGSVAASGGYYISAGANRIFADANTMTGSIGVVGGKLAIGDALAKLGIKSFPAGRGKRSMMWSTMSTWNTDERAVVQKMMEDIYKVFVTRVSAGRGKTYEEIHAIAQGRVWTGKAALENGLIDELGGLDAALAHAQKLAGMDSQGELEVYPPQPSVMDFVNSFAGGVFSGQQALLQEVQLALGPEAAVVVERALAQVASFRAASIQTTLILPLIWEPVSKTH